MKKRLLFFCIVLMLMVLAGCSTKPETAKNTPTAEATVKQSNIPEMKLNEPFAVKTENGSYTLTMEGARSTDDRLDSYGMVVEDVVFLDFSYDNIDFSSDKGDLRIYDAAFQVMDDEGTILNSYPSFDPNRQVSEVPSGARCDASLAYGLPKNSGNLHVIFRKPDNQKLGEITIPITK